MHAYVEVWRVARVRSKEVTSLEELQDELAEISEVFHATGDYTIIIHQIGK